MPTSPRRNAVFWRCSYIHTKGGNTPFAPEPGFEYKERLMGKLFKPLIDWYLGALAKGGYPLIVLLMGIESSIVPLPSELIIPPAAHLSHTGQIPISLVGIVIAGTLGSWLGATV